jgi:hypothetical protein
LPKADKKKNQFNPTTNVLDKGNKNVEGFVQSKGLVVGDQVNYGAKDRQI